MSERWGPCRSCQGNGVRLVQELIPGEDEELVRGDDGNLYYKLECWQCGGTGQSGDIQDYKG